MPLFEAQTWLWLPVRRVHQRGQKELLVYVFKFPKEFARRIQAITSTRGKVEDAIFIITRYAFVKSLYVYIVSKRWFFCVITVTLYVVL